MARRTTGYLDPGRDFVRVKQGFSWPALFFGIFWASAKKTWGALFLMLLVEIVLFALGVAVQASGSLWLALGQLLLQVVYVVLRGCFGNAWWRASLRRRGYHVVVGKPAPAP